MLQIKELALPIPTFHVFLFPDPVLLPEDHPEQQKNRKLAEETLLTMHKFGAMVFFWGDRQPTSFAYFARHSYLLFTGEKLLTKPEYEASLNSKIVAIQTYDEELSQETLSIIRSRSTFLYNLPPEPGYTQTQLQSMQKSMIDSFQKPNVKTQEE
jgi:hypothetical protein